MYDEPTAGLDPVASTVVEDLMRDLHNNRESTIASYIVVTHQHSTIRRAAAWRQWMRAPHAPLPARLAGSCTARYYTALPV